MNATVPDPMDCRRCKEMALVVEIGGVGFFVRPRRASRCEGYRAPGRGGRVCRTEIFPGAAAAVAAWDGARADGVSERTLLMSWGEGF